LQDVAGKIRILIAITKYYCFKRIILGKAKIIVGTGQIKWISVNFGKKIELSTVRKGNDKLNSLRKNRSKNF